MWVPFGLPFGDHWDDDSVETWYFLSRESQESPRECFGINFWCFLEVIGESFGVMFLCFFDCVLAVFFIWEMYEICRNWV